MLDPRTTERRNPRTASIDLATPIEIVDLINAEDRLVPEAVATQREQIAKAIQRRRVAELIDRWLQGGLDDLALNPARQRAS